MQNGNARRLVLQRQTLREQQENFSHNECGISAGTKARSGFFLEPTTGEVLDLEKSAKLFPGLSQVRCCLQQEGESSAG